MTIVNNKELTQSKKKFFEWEIKFEKEKEK